MAEAKPSDGFVRVTVERHFDATPEQVFDAWLNTDVARRWLFTSPDGATDHVEIDARVGGSFVFVDKRDGKPVEHQGTFLEIDRPHRLVFRFWTAEQPDAPDILTAEMTPDRTGTLLTLTHDLHPHWAPYIDFTKNAWSSMFDLLGVALDDAISFTMTRHLDAPRALVFRVWSEPEHMRRWFRPKDFTVVDGSMDFRTGGAWSSHMRAADGTDYRHRGVYREIVPDALIVFTHAWVDETGEAGPETVITVSLADDGEGTRLTFRQTAFASDASRDSHMEGWGEALDNLALHVAGAT